jgi:hypothetical protein
MLYKRLVRIPLLYCRNSNNEKENTQRTQSIKNRKAVFPSVHLCVFSVLLWLIKGNKLSDSYTFIRY